MSKVAAKKTASVLTDDLAVNAEKVVELKADRELPAVWAVCKGSLVNKAILVPLALGLNYVSPVIVQGLLVIGDIYLCYEDIESLIQKLTPKDKRDGARKVRVLSEEEAKRYEAKEIKGAITTDFVLSAEIVVITVNVVSEATFFQQVATLSLIALLVTLGVYGLVAGIVRIDDLGLRMVKTTTRGIFAQAVRGVGEGLGASDTTFSVITTISALNTKSVVIAPLIFLASYLFASVSRNHVSSGITLLTKSCSFHCRWKAMQQSWF